MEKVRQILNSHRFFCNKSQHYVMGDWNEYQEWFPEKNNYYFNKQKLRYVTGFPLAYIKFMYWSIKDIFNGTITQSKQK